ncbi:hypothetical protein [Lignipirellula cremea]|nr:hypothetical protein [Lignipirellula cremea]
MLHIAQPVGDAPEELVPHAMPAAGLIRDPAERQVESVGHAENGVT